MGFIYMCVPYLYSLFLPPKIGLATLFTNDNYRLALVFAQTLIFPNTKYEAYKFVSMLLFSSPIILESPFYMNLSDCTHMTEYDDNTMVSSCPFGRNSDVTGQGFTIP